jgi:hypothetical protein
MKGKITSVGGACEEGKRSETRFVNSNETTGNPLD